ncbi:MAG: hypothetical protein V6Z86_09610 [Hyphomicrobiales bacterium]
MKTRTLSNPSNTDFLSSDALRRYHANALRALLAGCRTHPALADRLTAGLSDRLLSSPDMTSAWSLIPEGRSYDQSAYITDKSLCGIIPGNADGRVVFSTTGSAGAPKLIVNAYEEVMNNAQIHGKGYGACGICADDIAVILGEVGRFAFGYTVIRALSTTGCTIVPLAMQECIADNLNIMNELRASVCVTMQSQLFRYLDTLEAGLIEAPPLRLIITGGEATSLKVAGRLKAIFGENLLLRSVFQTADAGTIGYQCPWCEEGEFHLHEELQFTEIIGADGGATKETGRLLVTNLYRLHSPVIRMATGDRAQWSGSDRRCQCGRTSRRLVLRGRDDHFYKLGGEKIASHSLIELLDTLDLPVDSARLVISRSDDGMDALFLEARPELGGPGLQRKVEKIFRDAAALQPLVARQCLAPIRVRAFARDDPHHRGFDKIKRIVDRRNEVAGEAE